MRAIIQTVPTFVDSSFAIQEYSAPHFSVPWHFHPEYELVLILKSEGKRFIGDSIKSYAPGDLVLIGSNVPHWYRNEEIYYQYERQTTLEASSLFIQFKLDFLGEDFFCRPETLGIKTLLENSQLGLEVQGKTRELVTKMMKGISLVKGMNRIIDLLSILNILSTSKELEILSNHGALGINIKDSERINTIYEFVMNNFKKPISIEDVSGLLFMCPETFCRYFKKRTKKNFTYFLNEIRIAHACKMLIQKDMSISEICFSSGYNNVSYFNRQFKLMKGVTPQAFKQIYQNPQYLKMDKIYS